jgi:hypothetical protein
MPDINAIMEDIAIVAFEANVKIASLALISHAGKILYQTKNWDLSAQTNVLLSVIKGNKEFVLNGLQFSVIGKDISKIVATNKSGMGSIVILTFQGKSLISYVMSRANPDAALDFLLPYTKKISEMK